MEHQQRCLTSISDYHLPTPSDFAPSKSKMADKTTSGSGYDHKFLLFALGFLIKMQVLVN